ncbi:MAG: sigma-54 dependent transcriptional regulator [Victivallales bacterium]|nr:sigma-54 dependent transcriptional regulator [Victivallales bacterium]
MKNSQKFKILILDDEKDLVEEIEEYLAWKGFKHIYKAHNFSEAKNILDENNIDIMFLDYRLPGLSGLEILKKIKKEFPSTEVIMMSGHGTIDTVIKALRDGAIDYLKKPFSNKEIMVAIQRTEKFVVQEYRLKDTEEKVSLISKELESKIERNFIGQSVAINEIYRLAMVASEHENTNVLISGESGTGKEIVARIIHHASKRKKGNFCIVNCAAIPSSLLESEFFGHIKGAFTGAQENKKGFFEVADKGTLFLDEIGEMPPEMQSKLLRAIEEQKIKRVGGGKEINVDCRVISATNINIKDAIKNNKFRLDLYHRLQTIEISIPPLRERREDIPVLLNYFSEQLAQKLNKPVPKISPQTVETLKNYHFPGNVRELRNLVERAIIISKDGSIDNLNEMVNTEALDAPAKSENLNLEELEREEIKKALQKTDGNQTQAAKVLGIGRNALIRRIKKYNIQNF